MLYCIKNHRPRPGLLWQALCTIIANKVELWKRFWRAHAGMTSIVLWKYAVIVYDEINYMILGKMAKSVSHWHYATIYLLLHLSRACALFTLYYSTDITRTYFQFVAYSRWISFYQIQSFLALCRQHRIDRERYVHFSALEHVHISPSHKL